MRQSILYLLHHTDVESHYGQRRKHAHGLLLAEPGTGVVPHCERLSQLCREWGNVRVQSSKSTFPCIKTPGFLCERQLRTVAYEYWKKLILCGHRRQEFDTYTSSLYRRHRNPKRRVHILAWLGYFIHFLSFKVSLHKVYMQIHCHTLYKPRNKATHHMRIPPQNKWAGDWIQQKIMTWFCHHVTDTDAIGKYSYKRSPMHFTHK